MGNWNKIIDLKRIWEPNAGKEPGHIDWKNTGQEVAKVIRDTPFFWRHEELTQIATSFEKVRGMKTFDNTCDRLWDWGDENNCWIRTVL